MLAYYIDLLLFHGNYTMLFDTKYCATYGVGTFYDKLTIPNLCYIHAPSLNQVTIVMIISLVCHCSSCYYFIAYGLGLRALRNFISMNPTCITNLANNLIHLYKCVWLHDIHVFVTQVHPCKVGCNIIFGYWSSQCQSIHNFLPSLLHVF